MRYEFIPALFRTYKISEHERKVVRMRLYGSVMDSEIGPQAKEAALLLSSIESKAGTFLAHISMMIAVTGIMLAVGTDNYWFEWVLGIELVSYLLLALLSIRCQFFFGASEMASKMKGSKDAPYHHFISVVFGELFYRGKLFKFVQLALYVLTFALIGTVIFGIFADEIGFSTRENV